MNWQTIKLGLFAQNKQWIGPKILKGSGVEMDDLDGHYISVRSPGSILKMGFYQSRLKFRDQN